MHQWCGKDLDENITDEEGDVVSSVSWLLLKPFMCNIFFVL